MKKMDSQKEESKGVNLEETFGRKTSKSFAPDTSRGQYIKFPEGSFSSKEQSERPKTFTGTENPFSQGKESSEVEDKKEAEFEDNNTREEQTLLREDGSIPRFGHEETNEEFDVMFNEESDPKDDKSAKSTEMMKDKMSIIGK